MFSNLVQNDQYWFIRIIPKSSWSQRGEGWWNCSRRITIKRFPVMPRMERPHASLVRAWRFRWTSFSSLFSTLIWWRWKRHDNMAEKDVLQISRYSTSLVGATVLLEKHLLCFLFILASSSSISFLHILNCVSMTFCSPNCSILLSSFVFTPRYSTA